jgi:hypothetical protein
MSIIEVLNMIKEFGYGEIDLLLYKVPGLLFVGDFNSLVTDNDILEMVESIRGHYKVDIFVIFLVDYGKADGKEAEVGVAIEGEEDSACKVTLVEVRVTMMICLTSRLGVKK